MAARPRAVPLASPADPLIRVTGLCKTYRRDGAPVEALRCVDVEIDAGEFVVIMGPSGSGKSTLMHVIGLIDGEYEGSYHFRDQRVSGRSTDELAAVRNREIGFVFQEFHLLPQLSIVENAALPGLYARDREPEECMISARRRLTELGLGARLDHRPKELSMGQRQRVAIARALVNEPSLILADEPTGALDSKTAREILDVFVDLHRAGTTIVLVTHDRDVANVAERIIHVRDGQTFEGLA